MTIQETATHDVTDTSVELIGPDQFNVVLDQRAKRLAQRSAEESVDRGAGTPVLVVREGEERYGIEVRMVTELINSLTVTPVPNGPPALLGISCIQSNMYSIIDFHALISDTPLHQPQSGCYLLLRSERARLALRIQRVEHIRTVFNDELMHSHTNEDEQAESERSRTTRDGLSIIDIEQRLIDQRLIQSMT